jgi:iron(III) transport system substrate-binding protein
MTSILWIVLALALWLSPARAQEDLQSLVEGAKKESSLALYMSMQTADIQKLIEGFRKSYPFAKVEFIPLLGERLLARIITEANAGRFAADIYRLDLLRVNELLKRNLFAHYTPPEAMRYPKEMRDPEGRWSAHALNLEVLGWNTTLLPKELAPRRFQDLLRPELKGKLGLEATGWDWCAAVQEIAGGGDKGNSFMKALAAQKPVLRRGHTLLSQLVAAGEDAVGLNVRANGIEGVRLKGAPVDWTMTDPLLIKVQIIGVAAKAPHPNMARLFANFSLSKQGQHILGEVGRTPADPDVVPSLSPRLSFKGRKVFVYRPEWGERGNELREIFEKLFG